MIKIFAFRCVPKVSYLTYLDKYVLGSLVMIISSCVWHSGIQAITKHYPHLMAKELGWLTIDKKVTDALKITWGRLKV